MKNQLNKHYLETINMLKQRIKSAQIKAALAVNSELIKLYWDIGNIILDKQNEKGWGSKIVDQLSRDLKKAFPDMKGFSVRNLKYMKRFAENYPDTEIVQQLVAQIPWGQNIALLNKISDTKKQIWYAQKCLENGWSRSILIHQIKSNLFDRQANKKLKTNNFDITLPSPQSDLAREMIKDPYKLDFLLMADGAHEKEIEKELVTHITHFLLELGTGFSFVGKQVHLELGKKDYYIDLLFYHLSLRCYVVIELKSQEFKPEHAGKLNFYLTLVDEQLRHVDDKPTIGMLLCREKDKLTAEYALKDINKPIGVSEYEIVESLPKDLKSSLPSIDELEDEFSKE